jgi:hypothetical protein
MIMVALLSSYSNGTAEGKPSSTRINRKYDDLGGTEDDLPSISSIVPADASLMCDARYRGRRGPSWVPFTESRL